MDASVVDWFPPMPELGITALEQCFPVITWDIFFPRYSYLGSSHGNCEFSGMGLDPEDYFLPDYFLSGDCYGKKGLESIALEYCIDSQVHLSGFGILESVGFCTHLRRCATKK